MSRSLRERWTLVAGLVGVLVFLGVCAAVLTGARLDRERLETRVGWVMGIQSAGDARALAAVRAVSACADCTPDTRAAAAAWLEESAAGRPAPSSTRLATALRVENAGISADLGAAWEGVEILLACAVAFAVGFFLLLDQARRRARETSAAYEALAAETRERESVERSLREEQGFSQGIFDFAPLGIEVFDAEGVLRRMNPEMVRILGLSEPDRVLGRFNVLTDPLSEETGLAELCAPAFRGEVVELRARRVDLTAANAWSSRPQTLVLDELYFPLLDPQGRVTHVVALFRDDTEGQAARERLSLAERLAAVGTLAAGVAHEINNPLTFISTNVAWLTREFERTTDALRPDLRAGALEALKEAGDGVLRVRSIVHDLSTFSRPTRATPTGVRLREVIEPTLRILDHELRHRATVVDSVPADATVQADPLALGQVVLNLVQNAAHAIEPGRPATERIELRIEPARLGFVRLTVLDTGRGIAPEIAGRVFEPFFTTKPVGRGMGLGLSVTRGIVESMGGQITFESTLGQGTTFHVDLPVAASASAAHRPVAGPVQGSRLRVLVIDDEPMLAPALRRLLGREHEVVGIESGTLAVGRLLDDRRWDAILLDVMMPELDGRAVLTSLKDNSPELLPRVVLMSGGTFSPETDAFWRDFEGPRLAKPFETGALERAIEQAAGVPVALD